MHTAYVLDTILTHMALPEFAEMLNEIRLGTISDKTVRSFQALSRPLHFDDGLEVTELLV